MIEVMKKMLGGKGHIDVKKVEEAVALGEMELVQFELMTLSSLCISPRVHLLKSVPFGYHLRTKRLQFSTEPFSHEA